jgi:replicative DNA helicase
VWFNGFAHPKFTDDQRSFYGTMLKECREDIPPHVEAGLMERMVAAEAASKLLDGLMKYNEGEEIDLLVMLTQVKDEFEAAMDRKVKTPWVRDEIEDLLKDDENDVGFHFRLTALNDCIRPLRPGDSVILAGRPDKGKTSAVADQLTYFAHQVDEVFPPLNAEGRPDPAGKPQDKNIGWFNNEGPGNKIVKRLYQCALNATNSQLVSMSQAGTVKAAYAKSIGGRADRIRVYDIHDFWQYEVEDVIRNENLALVVFDMVDNIKFGGGANNNGQRTDQLLEAMYQWARMMAVKHNCIVIMTSQISADGDNLAWPTLPMLKDSKTGKQGASDLIIVIGALDDFPDQRFIGATKNKLQREGSKKSPKAEVTFHSDTGRYGDPEQHRSQIP